MSRGVHRGSRYKNTPTTYRHVWVVLVYVACMPHTDTYGGPGSGAPDPDQLLTRKDAAALVGFSISTIKRWDYDGLLTPLRSRPKARPRYRRADVLAAAASHEARAA